MNNNMETVTMKMLERTKTALEKNRFDAYIANDCEQACEIAQSLMHDGALVASGGSMTLEECGMGKILRSGKYEYLDRMNTDDVTALYRKSFCADFYLCSSNAVTENGELYNVDGNANRVACICFGPDKVIMIVGRNKIVHNLDDAVKRVKTVAAPANTQRLSCKTYCHEVGKCMGTDGKMTDGCTSPDRICAEYLVSGFQRRPGRIAVILVNEELGF